MVKSSSLELHHRIMASLHLCGPQGPQDAAPRVWVGSPLFLAPLDWGLSESVDPLVHTSLRMLTNMFTLCRLIEPPANMVLVARNKTGSISFPGIGDPTRTGGAGSWGPWATSQSLLLPRDLEIAQESGLGVTCAGGDRLWLRYVSVETLV